MSRILPNWIDGYLTYMKDTEPPVTYFLWTAIGTLAGALQRRVYMSWGHNKIFPNMFIFLMGRSGLGKGIAMGPALEMFKKHRSSNSSRCCYNPGTSKSNRRGRKSI